MYNSGFYITAIFPVHPGAVISVVDCNNNTLDTNPNCNIVQGSTKSTYYINVLQDTTKITYDANVPRNNSRKAFAMCVEDSHSYISELLQKVPKSDFFHWLQPTDRGGGGFLLGKY